jgi:signal transduction histidine kinase
VNPRRSPTLAYLGAVVTVSLATVGTFAIYGWIEPSISLLFFPAVLVPSIYGGYGPGFLATLLSTIVLAYFFVAPVHSFNVGIDDFVRLAVFSLVASATGWVSSRRARAEEAQRKSLNDLEAAINTLRKVSGWPVLIAADTAASVRRMLEHAASVAGATAASAMWEAEDEPWLYIASSTPNAPSTSASTDAVGIVRHSPVELPPPGEPLPPEVARYIGAGPHATAAFKTEHLAGRVCFAGVATSTPDTMAIANVVAREVGNSLDQLYLAERLRELAIREDRIRLARDLHDGVLQSLTGVRLELQAIATASDRDREAGFHDRLLAIERALAMEQRELRLFIEGLKPSVSPPADSGSLAQQLDEMTTRLAAEWKVPIVTRVTPTDIALPPSARQGIRLMIHEAVVNALKHAHPSKVTVDVAARDRSLAIVVRDDGRGFPVLGHLDHEALVRQNAGPASLRERVIALGGRMSIDSTTSGSRVEVIVPSDQPLLLRA